MLQNDRYRLIAARVLLLLMLIGVFAVGRGTRYWPFVTWPMYSGKRYSYPPETYEHMVIDVGVEGGGVVRLELEGLFPPGREDGTETLIRAAFGDEDSPRRRQARRAITAMVADALPGRSVTTIQPRVLVYRADLLELRPIDPASPERIDTIGTLMLGGGEGAP